MPRQAVERKRTGADSSHRQRFYRDVVSGLRQPAKSLPCKYFYDRRGSALFDQICQLDEYYLTRVELQIMRQHAAEMGAEIGAGVMLVEYGSGSSIKTRLLLNQLPEAAAYVPVDISREHLHATARQLAREYPQLEVLPVCADFTQSFGLPASTRQPTHAAVYFPGSTIGNFSPGQAQALLSGIVATCGLGGGLLIGIDLNQDRATLEAAYNDRRGITDQFNRNLLRRINRELSADFDLKQFRHQAVYNQAFSRIEMHLVSGRQQTVTIDGERFEFAEGESICTEYSHKYAIDQFAELAAGAGLSLNRSWTDRDRRFGLLHLVVKD